MIYVDLEGGAHFSHVPFRQNILIPGGDNSSMVNVTNLLLTRMGQNCRNCSTRWTKPILESHQIPSSDLVPD